MKGNNKLILICLVALFSSCKDTPQKQSNLTAVSGGTELNKDFDWMLGSWIRINEEENRTTFESWEKENELNYIGFSYTIQNNDTIWQEDVELTNTLGIWSYNVTGEGEIEPTRFTLTTIEEGRFVCENPANEFPKIIEYSGNGNRLQAIISGNDFEVSFEFVKMENY